MRHLASGGMAEVLIARVAGIEGFERHVVIKKIRDEQATDARFVQMFLDEARLAASLHHHNIVHVHDIGQEDGQYFFAMEYVHGEDVRKLLMHLAERDERLPLDHCVAIVVNAAAALHHAHEHRGPDRQPLGIVHCDVSPANIVVGFDGNVKVVDFGIARVALRTTHTTPGELQGKVAYMSPEQCHGAPLDRRSDVFGLGIVLYELVTVRRLFKGANDFVTMRAITEGEIPPPSTLRPDLPAALEAIVMKALANDPADRYQTADELRAALEAFAAQAQLRLSTPALADYMRARFGDRPLPWLADEDEPELSIDFDGSGEGVALPPVELRAPTALLGRRGWRGRHRRAWLVGGLCAAAAVVVVAAVAGLAGPRSDAVPGGAGSARAVGTPVGAAPGSATPAARPVAPPVPVAPREIEMGLEPARDPAAGQRVAAPASPVMRGNRAAGRGAAVVPVTSGGRTTDGRVRKPGKQPPGRGVWDPKALLPPR